MGVRRNDFTRNENGPRAAGTAGAQTPNGGSPVDAVPTIAQTVPDPGPLDQIGGELEEAREHLMRALAIADEHDDLRGVHVGIAHTVFSLDDQREALVKLKQDGES